MSLHSCGAPSKMVGWWSWKISDIKFNFTEFSKLYSHASIQSSKATIFSILNRTAHKRVVSLKRSKYLKLAFTETLPALGQHMMFQTWFLQISSKPRRCLQTGLLAPNNPSLKLGALIVRFAWSLLFPLLLILTCWLQRTLGWGLGLSGPSRRGTSSIKTAESWEKIENCAENTEHSLAEPRALFQSSSDTCYMWQTMLSEGDATATV